MMKNQWLVENILGFTACYVIFVFETVWFFWTDRVLNISPRLTNHVQKSLNPLSEDHFNFTKPPDWLIYFPC